MIKSEEITINGIEFKIGYAIDKEFAGYICEMKKGRERYGVLFTDENNRELSFETGIMVTDTEIDAIKKARNILHEKYGSNLYHG
jgi:hypothetical protein